MSKKGIIILGGSIIGILVILLLVVWLLTVLKPRTYTYDGIEQEIISATKKYFKDHENELPKNDGSYSLQYSTLVAGEYIKPLNEILKDGNTCNAQVIINKSGNDFTYVPYLNCGENYVTRELYKQILEDNSVVTTGSGLYKEADGSYYFKGKINNNYVSFGSTINKNKEIATMWRIIGIDKNNNVILKSVQSNAKTAWDDRFNNTESSYVGYNTFDDSILSIQLKELYENGNLFTDEEKTKLTATNLCIGSRTTTDTTKDGSTECSKLSAEKYYIGTITPYMYLRASLDDKCINMESRDCSNYNYLANREQSEEWLITADARDDSHVYSFNSYEFNSSTAKSKKKLYLTINLNEYSFYKKGDGTENNPYEIKLYKNKTK